MSEVRNDPAVSGPPPPARRVATGPGPISHGGYRVRQFVWLAVIVVDVILALRFALLAVGAGDSGFTTIVYRIGGALAWPFQGVLGVSNVSGHPLQWVNILAIVVYTAAAWVVAKLVMIATGPHNRGVPAY
jgi:hypothetical protein